MTGVHHFVVLGLLFPAFLKSFFVGAIFADEAYTTDWLVSPIGPYKCVASSDQWDTLLVVSEFNEEQGLVSLLNKTSGSLITRKTLEYQVDDVMLKDASVVLKKAAQDGFVELDRTYLFENEWVPLANETAPFVSSCRPDNTPGVVVDLKTKTVKVIDEDSKLPVLSHELPENFALLNWVETDYKEYVKLLITTADKHSFYYHIQNGKLVETWTRDESLFGVVDHTFIDLQDHSLEEIAAEIASERKMANVWDAYWFRVTTDVERLLNFARVNKFSPGRMISKMLHLDSFRLKSGMSPEEIRNQNLKFGLSKLLVVLTKDGLLAALDVSRNGEIVWRVNTIPGQHSLKVEWFESSRELIVFTDDGSFVLLELLDENSAPVLKTEGNILKDRRSCSISSIQSLEDNGSFFVKYAQPCVHPSEIVNINDEDSIMNTKENFITDFDKNSITGYIVSQGNTLKRTWDITLDPETDVIMAYSGRQHTEVTNPGIILGSRDVLFKYLYPDLASFVVFNKQSQHLTLNVINTITGEVIYSQIHNEEHVSPARPINIVFGEHWVIYSYFSLEPTPEQKIVVVELYESLTPNKRMTTVHENPLTGVEKPEAVSLSYFFPQIIKEMAISNTKFDITTKTIILELENGQITHLPKFLLSARRKNETDMTDDDKKEFMASPYMATIPISDYYVITHFRDILTGSKAQLDCVQTNLESTSVACEIGHDIFCTRITPSGQFDVMSPTFEKGKLLMTVFVCLALCIFLKPYVTRKEVKTVWLIRD
ncbi:Emc1p KNAG_0C00360 [Huiozyma naganishii CBS 8797]|uniref:ER membrane protein complex subunit 1 n=1 Tax=Huiozyma naganishii (strain ATCC MYA-139 / BCRC 22969 / CBS 8797 / KCTC 17520 / NBRC 10181 / NCYC 3082 / Yp74L-3) TaxID=1071383 RepID=J7R2V2_HUIN7|nr:hypothetical protein KNAG_0C00360 [Kazachstania naganishii CBS 8797]CCK69150.1 hypothetical protein KNAG_0C00360 [Kazachstania naganishii CBS 8797]